VSGSIVVIYMINAIICYGRSLWYSSSVISFALTNPEVMDEYTTSPHLGQNASSRSLHPGQQSFVSVTMR